MQHVVIITFKNETSRNIIIQCLEKHFSNGLTFDHSIKTAKEQERIVLEIQPNDSFARAVKKYAEQGICKYLSAPKKIRAISRSQNRKLLEQHIISAIRFLNWISQYFGGP